MNRYVIFLAALLIAGACNSPAGKKKAETADAPTWSLTEIWRSDTILSTCESVLYDAENELLYVSCINGAPAEKNGKGFIACLNKDGSVKELHWATGLDAPKGMGIHEGRLWVTDIDRLVNMSTEDPQSREIIPVDGTSFLNDISIDKDGTVYFTCSDSGRLMKYQNGEVSDLIAGGLERPNGVYVENDRLLLSCSKSSDFSEVDKVSGERQVLVTGIGHGDGVEYTGKEGHYIVSSWSGEIFLILPDMSKISLLKTSGEGINSADVGFNLEKQVVYVPTFFDNRVVAYELKMD